MTKTPRLTLMRIGNGRWRHVLIFLLSFVVIFFKRPDSLLRAQFWAEDGFIFYSDAYNLGWFRALFRTYFGYFHFVPRLAAGLALLVPFNSAPLAMNVIAMSIYVIPVSLLMSSRCADFGSERYRAALATAYLVLPLSAEVRGILTCVQWVLGLSALFVLISAAPRNLAERVFDVVLLVASGLSGPFCFFLLPLAVVVAYRRPKHWQWASAGVLAVCCAVQASALLYLSPQARSATLGANAFLLLHIVGINVLTSSILGPKLALVISLHSGAVFALCTAAGGIALCVMMFHRARIETKCIFVLAMMVFIASLISPASTAPPDISRWKLLSEAYGIRYWFLPALAFIWLLIDTVRGKSKTLKVISGFLIVLFCICGAIQWKDPAFQDFHFSEYAARFDRAPNGTTVVIPVNPEGRTMSLVKHGESGK